MKVRSEISWMIVGAVATTMALGCSGGGSGGGGMTTTPTPTPSNPTSTTTITISSNTVSPKAIIVPRGSQVTFTNNDTVTHEMDSDPHPEHTNCVEINQVGFLAPGQSRQTGNLARSRTRPPRHRGVRSSRTYDVSRNGQRFLMVKQAPADQAAAPQIVIVQHWLEELKRLVPVN